MKILSWIWKILFKTNDKYETCQFCGKDLEGSQRKYCSNKCNGAYDRYVKAFGNPPRVSVKNAKLRGEWMNNPYFRKKKKAQQIAYKIKNIKGCYFCGKKAVHRHHPDYDIPELIIPLCAKCHNRLHALIDYKGGKENAKRI